MPATVLDVATPLGPARAHVHAAAAGRGPSRAVVLGHGAGGGIGARDLVALGSALPAAGVTTVLVEQPWRVAGGRVAPAPPRLDVGWRAVMADPALVEVLRPAGGRGRRSVVAVGGRSAGARVACRTAVETGADLVVCLAFPLHPPGRPERSRVDELAGAGVPALVVQGERDPFGSPDEVLAALASARGTGAAGPPTAHVVRVPGADHGMRVPASAVPSQADCLALLVEAVRGFLAQ